MSRSTASEISIDVAATTETSHPVFFKQVIMAAATLGNMAILSMFTAAAFFKLSSFSWGDMAMPLVLTVAAFFKEVSCHLLEAAEQLDEDVNHVIPHAPIVFILGSLIGFAGVKAQGDPDFPFNMHKMLIKCSITSLLFWNCLGDPGFRSACLQGPNSQDQFANVAEWTISVADSTPSARGTRN